MHLLLSRQSLQTRPQKRRRRRLLALTNPSLACHFKAHSQVVLHPENKTRLQFTTPYNLSALETITHEQQEAQERLHYLTESLARTSSYVYQKTEIDIDPILLIIILLAGSRMTTPSAGLSGPLGSSRLTGLGSSITRIGKGIQTALGTLKRRACSPS